MLTGQPVNKIIKYAWSELRSSLKSPSAGGGIIQETDVLPPAKGEAHLKTIIRGSQTIVAATNVVGQVDLYSLLPGRLI